MSILRHAAQHLLVEGVKKTTKYLSSSEFQRDTENIGKAVVKGVGNTCGGLNRVRAEISKTIGTENCSKCGKKIKAQDSVRANYKGSYCSSCSVLYNNRFY